VPDYRVYFIGRDGHFLRAIDIQVASDHDAIVRASELRKGHEVEVWERSRFVRRLSAPSSEDLPVRPDSSIGCLISWAPSRVRTLTWRAISSLWRKFDD
jgi:hypothetical protein